MVFSPNESFMQASEGVGHPLIENNGVYQRTVEQIVDVLHFLGETVEVVRLVPQERVQRIDEQNVKVPQECEQENIAAQSCIAHLKNESLRSEWISQCLR